MLNTSPGLMTAIVAAAAIVLLLVVFRNSRPTSKGGRSLPPGPPAPWSWKTAMPAVNISATFVEWAHKYGPVITVRQGSKITIIVARVDAANEIMEKEGSALADRPVMIAANEILSRGKRITLVGSGDHFRRLRKAVHTHFQVKAVETYNGIQFEEAKKLVLDILDDPSNHRKHVHRFSTSIILRITYGRPGIMSASDPDFAGVKQIVEHFIEGMRPNYLVDRFPWLKYVPGYGSRLKRFYEYDLKFYKGQLNKVERAMSSDEALPSFSKTLLETVQDHHLSVDEMAFLAGTVFEAGSDTSADAILVMIMAAACFPGAQARVHEELDTVVDKGSVPSWSDWDSLPQLQAFILEALRWRPVTPMGFAHRSTRDINWRGHYIPAGATVMGNHWAISRDPDAFPDPEAFDPQRWFDKDGKIRDDIYSYPFGFGRRVCPGQHLAKRSLFIALAFLLWSFRIVERPDAPVDTTPDRDNAVAHLAPFVVDFVPRIEEAQLRDLMAICA